MAPATAAMRSLDGTCEEHKLEHDHKREIDHRRKYALGIVDPNSPFTRVTRAQPVTPLSAKVSKAIKRQAPLVTAPNRKVRAMLADIGDAATTSDSSAISDVDEPSAAPEPDADITYSFDAPRGPTLGGEILSLAINKAVQRFESKETEKLVKNEYDVVGKTEDDDVHGGYTADDDFELV